MNISVVIPTRGRYNLLCQAINSIRAQDYVGQVEIIIIDDASEPPLPDLLPDIKLLRFNQQIGACAARNQGVKVAKGELILFLDDDAELLKPDDLKRAVNWFVNRPKLAIVGFQQLTSEREIHYLQPTHAETPVKTGLFFGYACLALRDSYVEVGGMNEEFGYYYEEVELSLKLHAHGYEIIYDPTLAVVHHQDNRHRNWPQIHLKTTRNALLSYFVHYPLWLLPFLIIKRIFFFAHQSYGALIIPPKDLMWLVKELLMRVSYIRNQRKPLTWDVVRRFHQLCGSTEIID
jgi:GT2 family glycosyltransferase